MNKTTKERFVGVDLAKIVAIFFVLVLHVNGGISVQSENLLLSFFHRLISSISCTCIDIFALATGFLCVNSACRYSRIASLWASTFFWGIVVLLFTNFCLGYHIPLKAYFNACFPILRMQYWFFTAYFMLFFFMPCLNKCVQSMTKKEFLHLFAAIGVFICGYSIFAHDPFCMHGGYSFAWLCIVYLNGAYLRIYPPCKCRPVVCFVIALMIAFVSCLRQFVSVILDFRIPGDRFAIVSYVSPFTLAMSIMIFLGCVNMKFSCRVCRFLKTVAATTFGIYLIHVQPFFWDNVWRANLRNIKVESILQMVLIVFALSTISFIGLSILEYCRIKLFSRIGIDNFICKVDKLIGR